MSVKLAAALPKDQSNGLNEHHMELGEDYVIVALVRVNKITEEYHSDEPTPTLQINAIEAHERHSAPGSVLARAWREAYEDRTGNRTLPFDDEQRRRERLSCRVAPLECGGATRTPTTTDPMGGARL